MRRILWLCAACFVFVSSARAQWLEASSEHFLIYGEEKEEAVRTFAERLERYHAALARVFKQPALRVSPSNRVTIYVVSSEKQVQRLAGTNSRYLAGYYRPRAGASVAVVPRLGRQASKFELSSETVLYHEYAHHFMYGMTARSFPRWFVEGFAEFCAGVKFLPDGAVGLGAPATHRAPELYFSADVPIRTLLAFDGGASTQKTYNAFYGQSWLLFHYLQFDEARFGQIDQYQRLLAQGTPALQAAEKAFGDLDQLARDMEAYQRRRRISYLSVSADAIKVSPVTMRRLRPGEEAILPTQMRSRMGVTQEQAVALVPEARSVAAKFPDDPRVLGALAEAEMDSGNDDAAIAAADRAIALDGGRIDAYIQKGLAMGHKVATGALPKEAWKDVRAQWVRANQVENDNPIPLMMYYFSYVQAGVAPTQQSKAGLEWAMQLAPFDGALRWMVAQQMIEDRRLKEAVKVLEPLAYSPHPGEHTERALLKLKSVEAELAAPSGNGAGPAAAPAAPPAG